MSLPSVFDAGGENSRPPLRCASVGMTIHIFVGCRCAGNCHPDKKSQTERTRISCHTALDQTTCASFRKERRTKFAKATKSHSESRVAEVNRQFHRVPTADNFATSAPHSRGPSSLGERLSLITSHFPSSESRSMLSTATISMLGITIRPVARFGSP